MELVKIQLKHFQCDVHVRTLPFAERPLGRGIPDTLISNLCYSE